MQSTPFDRVSTSFVLLGIMSAISLSLARPVWGQQKKRCAGAIALSGLAPDLRKRVKRACEDGEQPDEDSVYLQPLVRHPPWQTALLLSMLPLKPVPDEDVEEFRNNLNEHRQESRKHKGCSDALQLLEEDAEARKNGSRVKPCVTRETFAKCISGEPKSHYHFITIAADRDDELRFAYAKADKAVAGLADQWVDVGGYRYFILHVPKTARVVTRLASLPSKVPEVLAVSVVRDYVANEDMCSTPLPKPFRTYCIEVTVGAAKDTIVLLDGEPLMLSGSGTFWGKADVRFGDHNLVALNAQGSELARETIAAGELSPTQCVSHAFDLMERKETALAVNVDPECVPAGVVPMAVRVYARNIMKKILRRSNRKPSELKDLEGWGDVLDGVGNLTKGVSILGLQAAGAERGRLDTLGILQKAAGELTRQGFSEAYIGRLSCGTSHKPYSFNFVAYRLNVAKIRNKDWSEITGLPEINNTLESQNANTTTINDLRDIIALPLTRLANQQYVRLVSDQERVAVHLEPQQMLEVSKVPKTTSADIELYRLEKTSGETFCRRLARKRRLLDPTPLDRFEKTEKPIQKTKIDLTSPNYTIPLEIDKAGLYLVKTKVSESTTMKCVRAEEPDTRVWLSYNGSMYSVKNSTHHTFLVGLTLAEPGSTGIVFLAGFCTTHHSLDSPPSWNDTLQANSYDESGHLAIRWTRRTALMGLGVEHDILLERWVSLFLRGSGLLELGALSTKEVPEELSDFLDNRKPGDTFLDVDLSILLQVGTRFRVGRAVDLLIPTFGVRWVSPNDVFDSKTSLISNDHDFVVSASAGVGLAL